MTTIRCRAFLRAGVSARHALAATAGLLLLLPGAGQAQVSTCSPALQIGLNGPTFADIGSVYTVDVTFGVGAITNGTEATISAIRYNLDCEGGDESDILCDSATAKISYQGNLSVNMGCPEQNWTATHMAGDLTPNRVTFTPDGGPFTIAENTSPCTLTFQVEIEEFDDAGDSTPGLLESNAGFDGSADDIECDNGLSPSATAPASIPTCPVCDDGEFCNGEETCDTSNGECLPGTPLDCDDEATCTTDMCNEETDRCDNVPNDSACDDQDMCTDNVCDPESSSDPSGCTFPTAVPLPEECLGDFVCRTCGFWGNHPDIVQTLLDDAMPPIAVCGGPDQNTTEAEDPASANEAICVKVQGEQYRQLARQLTCLQLNCQFSGTGEDCEGGMAGGQDLGALFDQCDAVCATAAGGGSESGVGACITRVDCINNGGTPVQTDPGEWTCAGGECSIDGELCGFDEGACAANECDGGFCTLGGDPCTVDADCTDTQFCDLFEAVNCHQADLCPEEGDYCFEPPGSASPGDCKDSRGSKCTYADLDCP